MLRALEDRIGRIEAAINAGEALINGPLPTGAELAKRALEAGLMVGAYQLHVQREFFDRYATHPDPEVRDTTEALRRECSALRGQLHGSVRKTAAEAPDPNHFARTARLYNAAFRSHFGKVRALVARVEGQPG